MIGQRLRAYRKEKGFKLKELAAIIGYSQGGLSDIENEKARPSTQTLVKLIQNTDINIAWLLTGKGPMKRAEPVEMLAERIPPYGQETDDVSGRIVLLLKDMPEEDRRALLRSVEDKKLIREIREERKKMKG